MFSCPLVTALASNHFNMRKKGFTTPLASVLKFKHFVDRLSFLFVTAARLHTKDVPLDGENDILTKKPKTF